MNNTEISKREELSKILLGIAQTLEITKTQYEKLVTSYRAVGKYLEEDTLYSNYNPIITLQGSLRLGTTIKPINEDDDLDVDLVFRLLGKDPRWTQKNIKVGIGYRLTCHKVYQTMLQEEGRRCWTLLYRQDSDDFKERYHMDILPCVVDPGYDERHERMIVSGFLEEDINKIAIRITDNKTPNYGTSVNIEEWMKSNPDGYAIWFAHRCKTYLEKSTLSIIDRIMPTNQYTKTKSILQRIVQLLKRHRDIMFNGDDDKPISIIITTLAARSYNGEPDLFEGFCNVVENMASNIGTDKFGNRIISNPVDPEENFADKWASHPTRERNFFKWLAKLNKDKNEIIKNTGVSLRESLGNAFGTELTQKVFSERATTHKIDAENSKLKVAATGIIGSVGKTLNAKNTFYGKE